MDGTLVPTKQPTAMQRENDLIKTIKQLTCSEKYLGKKALPVMARQVFVEVLQSLGVKVAFADGEADKVVAAMAKMHGCCAVSKDSDFFIFDLPAGYIPVDNLDIARNGASITAKRFSRPKFCADLKLNVAMLPLLASAIGNDHVSVSLLRPFHVSLGDLGEVEFPATWNMGDKDPTVRDQLIVRVASFLASQESETAAIAAIVKAADEQFKADEAAATAEEEGEAKEEGEGEKQVEVFTPEALKAALETSIEAYKLDPKQAAATGATTELTTKAKCGMDAKLIALFRDGKIDPKIMDVLSYNMFWCNGLVEDVDGESAYLPSRSIRQEMYAVLLEGSAKEVTEHHRKWNEEMGKHTFQPEVVTVGSSKIAFSNVLKGAADAKARTELLFQTIGAPAEGVPERLKFPSACIRFWMKQMISSGGITAVELAAITASLLQDKEEQSRRVSKEARPNWLSLKQTTRLAALQTTFLSANLLNQALANPVVPMSAATIYDGEFIHRFHHLQQRAKGMSALSDQLRKDKVKWEDFHELYKQLSAGMEGSIQGEITETFEGGIMWGPSGPEGAAQGPAKAEEKGANALNNGVEAGGLFGKLLGDEDDEEDEEEEATVAVAVDYSAAEEKAKAKKKEQQVDDDLAKLMADMESVDSKREEQAARERARKNAQKKKK
eukprot:Tamp_01892.p1 GENE.Tamp_01892~~Tamp_01892.p1  ORF type:complete len:668 (+),score=247.48 Tamp_01892:927-2930(+)